MPTLSPARSISLALAALLAALALPASAATIAVDTFGPNDAYDDGASGLVGPGPTGTVQLGFVFTAAVDAPVATLTAPLSSNAGPSILTMTLYEWDGERPTTQVDVAPIKLSSATPGLFFASDWSTPLRAGQSYAMVASSATQALWWQTDAATSLQTFFILDGGPATPAGWTPAVRVELAAPGPAPIPAPGALGLLLGALVALGLAARRGNA